MNLALKIGALLMAPALLFGCSGGSDGAPSLVNGKHPDNWLTAHRAAYRVSPDQCRECHGNDLKGGIAKVDCFNQGNLPSCHANGHGPRSVIHPVPFTNPALHGPMAKQDLVVCQDCHGQTGGAGSNPRFNLTIGSLATGCEASGCHLPNMAHPKPWNDHASAGNQANACALCHGATFGGPADPNGAGVGPACSSCHTSLTAGTLPVPGQCVSCHGTPPNGTTAPNRAGSHAAHLALPELQNNCSVCHNGGGIGTAAHFVFGNLTVAVLPSFNAESGIASRNADHTCANVKCHGGLTTPAWGTALNVTTGCLSCHTQGTAAQTPQYNSFYSGEHQFHLQTGLFCTDCHDMSNQNAPSHFSNLSSVTFNQPASSTIRSYINYDKTGPSCMPPAAPPAGTQFGACHSDRRFW